MRWLRYVRTSGEAAFRELWSGHEGPVLAVVGAGFDPRGPRVVQALSDGIGSALHVLVLGLDEQATDPAMAPIATANLDEVKAVVASCGGDLHVQDYPDVRGRRSAGVHVSRSFHADGYLERFQTIIIDISSLPRSLFFPLISGFASSC